MGFIYSVYTPFIDSKQIAPPVKTKKKQQSSIVRKVVAKLQELNKERWSVAEYRLWAEAIVSLLSIKN